MTAQNFKVNTNVEVISERKSKETKKPKAINTDRWTCLKCADLHFYLHLEATRS